MKWKKLSRFGMKLALSQLEGPKKLIALDLGSLSTGVAVSDIHLQKSYLLKVIKSPIDSPTFAKKLRQVVSSEQNLKGIIVGRPIFQTLTNQINTKMDNLLTKLESPPSSSSSPEILYCFEDQNWTTKQAKQRIKEFKDAVSYHGHLHNEKELEDGLAAMKILERFMAYNNTHQS